MSERAKKLKYFFGWKEMITKPIPTQLKRQTSLIYTYNKIKQTLNKNKEKQKTTMSSANETQTQTLAEVRQKIEDEIEWVDIKPYSHNIISASLMMVSAKWGKEAANDIIMDFDLEDLGWNTVETKNEEPVKKKKATKKKKLVVVEELECACCGTTCLDHTSNKGRGSESPCEKCDELRCKYCPCECDDEESEDEYEGECSNPVKCEEKSCECYGEKFCCGDIEDHIKTHTDRDEEYNRRCENGEAKCEECGKWGQALDMDYDDDTGFHICCDYDAAHPYANEGATYEDL